MKPFWLAAVALGIPLVLVLAFSLHRPGEQTRVTVVSSPRPVKVVTPRPLATAPSRPIAKDSQPAARRAFVLPTVSLPSLDQVLTLADDLLSAPVPQTQPQAISAGQYLADRDFANALVA